jgi:type 1 fimbria pilin
MKKLFLAGVALAVVLAPRMSALAAAEEKMSITGEVIDTECYATSGAKGDAHRDCALACAKAGIPVGLLEDGTDKVYILLPNKPATALPAAVMDNMARKVTITGTVIMKGGSQFLSVDSVK